MSIRVVWWKPEETKAGKNAQLNILCYTVTADHGRICYGNSRVVVRGVDLVVPFVTKLSRHYRENIEETNIMEYYINKLADPHLVARIQRACGVRPAPDVRPTGTPIPADSENTCQHTNGISSGQNGTETRNRLKQTNGHSQYDQNTNGTAHHSANGQNLVLTDSPTNGHVVASQNGDHKKQTLRPLINQDGVTPNDCFQIDGKFLYTLFSLGAELGNESFYILFYPYFFWNIDGWVARRVCWFWCLFMYAGQAAKDLIKWPRPAAPPVFRLEKKYAFEYGMPSTHAMVGVGLPFLTYYLFLERYEFNWAVGLVGTLFWCAIVCFSRLYLGMHSVLDVLAGIAFSTILLPVWISVMDPLDHFIMTHPAAPYLSILVPLAMCLSYPRLEQWSTARGDTTLVIGVGAGVAVSQWINYQYGLMGVQTLAPPYAIPALSLQLLADHAKRMVIGGVIALITRAFFKTLTYRASCAHWNLDPKDPTTKQHLCVELPVKFITYVALSLVVVVLTPMLFKWMDIGRTSFYTEL